jgi:hypothetical protein
MFVEKFLIADQKWTSTFCDNWILQKRAILRNVHFDDTTWEYKNIVRKKLKTIKYANVAIFQDQYQSQSQSKKSTFSIFSKSKNDKSRSKQCVCDKMHEFKKYSFIIKNAISSELKKILWIEKW